MPTNRTRRLRRPVDTKVPAWAVRLLEGGERPERGSDEEDAYFGWLFFGETVPGLPDVDSPEGRALWSR